MERELIPLRDARERLGVSKAKMAELVRHRIFPVYANPLDKREKLVDWAEVQESIRRPRPLDPEGQPEGKAAGWSSSRAA